MTRIADGAAPPGAPAKLLRLIRGDDGTGTVPEFAEKHNIGRVRLQNLLNGTTRHPRPDLTTAIEVATRETDPRNVVLAAEWGESGAAS